MIKKINLLLICLVGWFGLQGQSDTLTIPTRWNLENGVTVGGYMKLSFLEGTTTNAILVVNGNGFVDTISSGSLGLDSAQVLSIVRNNVDTSGTLTLQQVTNNGNTTTDTISTSAFKASGSSGLSLLNSGGTTVFTIGSGGGVNATFEGNVSFGGTSKIVNLADGTAASDAATVGQLNSLTWQETLDNAVNGDSVNIDSVIQIAVGADIKFTEDPAREKEFRIFYNNSTNRLVIETPSKEYQISGNEFFSSTNANLGTEALPFNFSYSNEFYGDAFYTNSVNINTVSGDTIDGFGLRYVRESNETVNDTVYLNGYSGSFIDDKIIIEMQGGSGDIVLIGGAPNAAANVSINGSTGDYTITSGYKLVTVRLIGNDSYAVYE